MTKQDRINQFVQDVYLIRFNRLIDSMTSDEGVNEIAKTLSFCRMYKDELQRERDTEGKPVNWNFARTNDNVLGTISSASSIFELPDEVLRLVYDDDRPLILEYDGSIISKFEVVDPSQITRRRVDPSIEERVSVVKRSLVFSRIFKDYEIGATVKADTIEMFPELTATNVELLDMVPYKLLTLGTAKISIRPDLVQGGLAPSFVQEYADELDKVIAENNVSSQPDTIVTEDFSGIGGAY